MQECCTTGFMWNGTPSGREGTLGDVKAYIAGDNSQRAVFMCHDVLGWNFKNTRLLADHYAKEVGATVYLPDFFHGEAVDEKYISVKVEDGKAKVDTKQGFDFGAWFQLNSPDVRLREVLDCARRLKEQYSWVGMVGFCWGGSVGFKLASKENSKLFNCISIAHPGPPTEDEVRGISLPFQIIAPQYDPRFPDEMKEFCNKEIPKLGVEYVFHHFPGMAHGFATKCDPNKEEEKKALEQAKNAVVFWFVSHAKK